MPILNLTLSIVPSAELAGALAAALTDLTALHLHKNPELTAVALSSVAPANWHIGARPLAQHGKTSFYLSIVVSAGTNTPEQKSAFIAAVFAALAALLGEVHPTSYIRVDDAHPDSWGYGGQTQHQRAGAAARAKAGV